MSPDMLRALGALVLGVIMGMLALGTRGQPYRRSAMGIGALSLLLLAAYNAGPVYDYNGEPFSVIALVVLVGAMVCYILSWRKGELLKRHEQLRKEMAEATRKRREAAESNGSRQQQ